MSDRNVEKIILFLLKIQFKKIQLQTIRTTLIKKKSINKKFTNKKLHILYSTRSIKLIKNTLMNYVSTSSTTSYHKDIQLVKKACTLKDGNNYL